MIRFPVAKFVRNGRRVFVWLNLPVAVLGVAGALLWAPDATGEELVLVVGLPLLLFTLGVRMWMAVKPQQELPDDRAANKAIAKFLWAEPALLLLLIGTVLILLGFVTLAAVPIYVALGIDWAPGFGVLGATLLVVFGIGACVLATAMVMSPGLFLDILRSARTPFEAIRGLFVSSH